MRAEIYWVKCEGKDRIAIMPRPRGGEWLRDEIRSLKQQGVDVLVSLLTPAESRELGLSEEPELCSESTVRFISFPISDRQIPTADSQPEELVDELRNAIGKGQAVAIHCRMGLGRSAILVGALLASRGVAVDHALSRIAKARGLRVPDTEEQVEWLRQFAARRANARTTR